MSRRSISQAELRELVGEVLERNPAVAVAQAQARAAARRAPQVRALPDPVSSLTAFLEAPETHTLRARVNSLRIA